MSEKAIRDALKSGKLVIGRQALAKAMKKGAVASVFHAENCPSDMLRDLEHYSRTSKVPVEPFKGSSAFLGQLCGKPFKIVAVGIEK
jgi:ribosomal protein L30E